MLSLELRRVAERLLHFHGAKHAERVLRGALTASYLKMMSVGYRTLHMASDYSDVCLHRTDMWSAIKGCLFVEKPRKLLASIEGLGGVDVVDFRSIRQDQ